MMDDLISRQDAIDLVESFYKIDKSVLKIMVFKLKQLPSVQPEFSNNSKELENKNGELISRQDAIDALKICDNDEDGINCHKCPLRDERWDGAWEDNETTCYRKLMRDSAKLLELPSVQPERTCVNCGRTANNGGWYADGRTRCPIEEHYALPKDGYCHLWEKRNITDDDYPERRTDE